MKQIYSNLQRDESHFPKDRKFSVSVVNEWPPSRRRKRGNCFEFALLLLCCCFVLFVYCLALLYLTPVTLSPQLNPLPTDALLSAVSWESSPLSCSSGGSLALNVSSLVFLTTAPSNDVWSLLSLEERACGGRVTALPSVSIPESTDKPFLRNFVCLGGWPTWKDVVFCRENFLCLMASKEIGSEEALFLRILYNFSLRRLNRGSDKIRLKPWDGDPWTTAGAATAGLDSLEVGSFTILGRTVSWFPSVIW